MQFDAESGCLNNYISPDLISTYVSRPFSRINISEIAEEPWLLPRNVVYFRATSFRANDLTRSLTLAFSDSTRCTVYIRTKEKGLKLFEVNINLNLCLCGSNKEREEQKIWSTKGAMNVLSRIRVREWNFSRIFFFANGHCVGNEGN